MPIKLLALACPVVLFVFKYLLPSFAEEAFSNKKRARGQAKIEFIHFPVDLLFVAISYTIPKIIEVANQFSGIESNTGNLTEEYNEIINRIVIYSAESIGIIMLVPFFVFVTKFAENNYFQKKKRWIAQTFGCYFLAAYLIWISVFRT